MQPKKALGYRIIRSAYGEIGLVWSSDHGAMQIKDIVLPRFGKTMRGMITETWPQAKAFRGADVPELASKIDAYLAGKRISFRLDDLNGWDTPDGKETIKGFRSKVMLATFQIPRGKVETYGSLAGKSGYPGAARAVGTVMARNPFPLVIPCHRVIRSDRQIGNYGGGKSMKQGLLQMEGVDFDATGRVMECCLFEEKD